MISVLMEDSQPEVTLSFNTVIQGFLAWLFWLCLVLTGGLSVPKALRR